MKVICKCGNIEDLKTDKLENFKLKNCGDGTALLICKNCSESEFIKLKNI